MSQPVPPSSDESGRSGSQNASTQFVGFRLDGQEFAFPIGKIQEIVIPDQVTKIPQVDDYVDGVSNLRGSIIPIINLRKLFGLKAVPNDSESRTFVVNVGDKTLGCTVDSVTQGIRVPNDTIQPAPEMIAGDGTNYVFGFAKLEDRLLILLDPDELLDPDKLEQVRKSQLSLVDQRGADS